MPVWFVEAFSFLHGLKYYSLGWVTLESVRELFVKACYNNYETKVIVLQWYTNAPVKITIIFLSWFRYQYYDKVSQYYDIVILHEQKNSTFRNNCLLWLLTQVQTLSELFIKQRAKEFVLFCVVLVMYLSGRVCLGCSRIRIYFKMEIQVFRNENTVQVRDKRPTHTQNARTIFAQTRVKKCVHFHAFDARVSFCYSLP